LRTSFAGCDGTARSHKPKSNRDRYPSPLPNTRNLL